MGNTDSTSDEEAPSCEKFASEFLAAVQSANPLCDPTLSLPRAESAAQFGAAVFAFPLLSGALCRGLVRHLEALQAYYGFTIDATGIVLDNDLALHRLFCALAHCLFVPLLHRLAGLDGVDGVDGLPNVCYQHALCVRFDARGQAPSGGAQVEGSGGHAVHTDAADVTLNVCLSEHFAGGALVFHRADGSVERVVERRQGECVVHHGRRLHSAQPLYFGTRYSLVLWFRYCSFQPFLKLPEDLQLHIVTLTDFQTARAFCCLNRKFDNLANSTDALWTPLLPAIDPTGKYTTVVRCARERTRNKLETERARTALERAELMDEVYRAPYCERFVEDNEFIIPQLPLRSDACESKKECFILQRATQWRSQVVAEIIRMSFAEMLDPPLLSEKRIQLEEISVRLPRINPFANDACARPTEVDDQQEKSKSKSSCSLQ